MRTHGNKYKMKDAGHFVQIIKIKIRSTSYLYNVLIPVLFKNIFLTCSDLFCNIGRMKVYRDAQTW